MSHDIRWWCCRRFNSANRRWINPVNNIAGIIFINIIVINKFELSATGEGSRAFRRSFSCTSHFMTVKFPYRLIFSRKFTGHNLTQQDKSCFALQLTFPRWNIHKNQWKTFPFESRPNFFVLLVDASTPKQKKTFPFFFSLSDLIVDVPRCKEETNKTKTWIKM